MKKLLQLTSLFITMLFITSCGSDSGGPNPEITNVQPESGPPGTSVTIGGKGFRPKGEMSVTFGGTAATLISATEDQIQTEVPEGLSEGSAPVNVSVEGVTASGPSFMVEAKAPGISSVKPDSGTVGTEVAIKGMNFSSSASEVSISFAGTAAQVKDATEDQLITEVPEGATDGPVEVVVKQKSTTGPDFDVITDGVLEVITENSGPDQDPDGYELLVDGSGSNSIGINDTLYIPALAEGVHDIELKDVAQKCALSGSNPRSVNITAGDTTSTVLDVFCQQPKLVNKIVFNSDRDGDDEIYVMDPDGSNIKKLTDNDTFDGRPVVSNDGTKIAFQSRRNSNPTDLYIMDADGSDVRKVTDTSGGTYGFSWSPDDSQIVYLDTESGGFEIYTINADGSGRTRLTNNSSDDLNPSWSPDGSRIVFNSDRNSNNHIFSMDPDGSDVKQLTSGLTLNADPSWSPNGSKITFTSNRAGGFAIHVMDPDGSNIQQVTTASSSTDLYPNWSPDGTEIVFETDRDGNSEIYKIAADGSGNALNLTKNPAIDRDPFWSPVK